MAAVACGIDWAEGHHDVAIIDEYGEVLVAERIGNDAAGLSRLLQVLGEHDTGDERLPVAIETSSGLLVAGLRAAARTVYAINPLAVSRYRDRYRTSGGKSDAFDAMVLANVLRTDRAAHRQLPDDSPAVQALRVLTRAQQDAVWERTDLTNRIRSLLKSFFLPHCGLSSVGQASTALASVPNDPGDGADTHIGCEVIQDTLASSAASGGTVSRDRC